ncbi:MULTISPECIES: serine hydrolase domain-containing protein [Flavobacteriaceae]|uniref:serine hydrolase domain-containing protein n=1 Tax=Flavobacteriaceae TaxID=49546 RepID=UPI00234B9E29|nr:serine hydrolase domain-containing protein [Muricauda sp. SP22]MDC6363603.1 serine hydrolase [Muricauda sp. SP22]
MMRTFYNPFFLLAFLFWGISSAQLPADKAAKIDSLFLEWNRPNHPGGSIAIMQGDKTVFSKAYGLASMEYLVPNSPSTQYNVASVSKQFSALGIVRLHLQGRLSIDDTIDNYIDQLPEFGQRITIRHMLHHTSGLRSLHALLALAGWRGDDYKTNADLNRIIVDQEELNFEPGAEYLYCNTGYMFLANIIEKVTGKTFVGYMQQEIFAPLGMENTYVEDQYNRVVPNNATSYNSTFSGFNRAVEYWGYVGSGNMHTTAADLLKYLRNFYAPLPGWEKAFELMETMDPLNDGSHNQYAFGVNVDDFFGEKRISHGGSIGGFRSNVAVFPEKEISIVVLTNFSRSGPASKVSKIAEILLGDVTLPISISAKKISKSKMKSYEGYYWDDVTLQEQKIEVSGDTLFLGNGNSKFIPVDIDRFEAIDRDNKTILTFQKNTMTMLRNSGGPLIFKKYTPLKSNAKNAEEFIGTYYSPEIQTAYTVHFSDGKLYAHHIRHGKLYLDQKQEDLFTGEYPLSVLKFIRDGDRKIKGVRISNGRARNLWFLKQRNSK